MRLLLDTHLLLWAAYTPQRLSLPAREAIAGADNELLFSAASLWEIAIKTGLGRADFQVDVRRFRRELLEHAYHELPVTGEHVAAVSHLPFIHRDPFDRLLVAQAMVEGIALFSADATVAAYGGPVHRV